MCVAVPEAGRTLHESSDADHANDEETRHSTSCCHLLVGGHLVGGAAERHSNKGVTKQGGGGRVLDHITVTAFQK